MAASAIRLRRTLRALSAIHRSFSSATSASPISLPMRRASASSLSRSFRSSSASLLSTRPSSFANKIPDEIGPDTILFEGCDYNHWLFVIDFPKDEDERTPEEMVRMYEETCAKGLNISVEEAKKKIYACSCTTYTGFQAVMSEEESKRFEGIPGVMFVLPDSYIDPVNKQYGGDQYINGTIIPRPPPIQRHGRNEGRRPREDNQMSNPSYNNRGPMQRDGRNYGPSQNYQPRQIYPPQQSPGQASQNYPSQQNYSQTQPNHPPQQNYGQAQPNYPPQQNYNQAQPNYPPQQNYSQAQPNYPPQQNFGQAPQNYPPQQNFGQAPQNHPQQQRPQYAPQQSFVPPGQGERSYAPPQNFGSPGQGERRDPEPRHSGAGASGAWGGTFTPSYMNDFKPSFMEEFENADQDSHPAKEQTGSQQRYPPPGQGNFTGEGRY